MVRLMKHTPGPWSQGRTLETPQTRRWTEEQIESNDREERRRVFANFSAQDQGRGRHLVATCETEPDAALIAAAPDLLFAAKQALDLLSAYAPKDVPIVGMTKRDLEKAITKAEGGAIEA